MTKKLLQTMTVSVLLLAALICPLATAEPKDDVANATNIPLQAKPFFIRIGEDADGYNPWLAEQIGKVPGVTPALMELLKKIDLNGSYGDAYIWNIFQALRHRKDVSESGQTWFRKQLKALWNLKTHSALVATFKEHALLLLGRFPSAENQRLLIHYLHEDFVDEYVEYSFAAIPGLKKWGGAAALDELQAYAKTRDSRFDDYKEAMAAIKTIKERLSASEVKNNR